AYRFDSLSADSPLAAHRSIFGWQHVAIRNLDQKKRRRAMGRIGPITSRDQIAEADRQYWDEIVARRGEPSGPTFFFLNSPHLGSLYSQLADYPRINGLLNPGQVRLVALLVGRAFNAEYIWAVNVPHLPESGPSQLAFETIGKRGDLNVLEGEEKILAKF